MFGNILNRKLTFNYFKAYLIYLVSTYSNQRNVYEDNY